MLTTERVLYRSTGYSAHTFSTFASTEDEVKDIWKKHTTQKVGFAGNDTGTHLSRQEESHTK